MTEKSVYKVSSQGKAWGSDISLGGVIFLPVFLSSKFLENIFVEGKGRTDPDLKYQKENPTLGALSYLHVGVQFGGIRIETRNDYGSWLGGTW